MMEYRQNYLLNNCNLASVPFCPSKEDLCNNVTISPLCDFYFNGFSSSNEVLDKTTTNVLDEAYVASDYYSLDIFENGLTSLQQNDDILYDSITSLDDLSFELLDNLSSTDDNLLGDDSDISPQSTPSYTSVADDHLLEFLEKLDTDKSISEDQDYGILQFHLETPSSPVTNSSSENMMVESIDLQVVEESKGFKPSNSKFVKIPTSEAEIMFTDMLSPQSVDSGISLSSSPNANSLLFDEVSIDMVDLFNMTGCESDEQGFHTGKFTPIKHVDTNSILDGNQILDMDIHSPGSIDSGISGISDKSCDSLSRFHAFSSQKVMSLQGSPAAGQYEVDFLNGSDSISGACRYTPYKAKKKTPEQKQRKQKQNRNAASKYRTKKKEVFDNVFAEAGKLEEKNNELKGKVEGLRKEIDYLKTLMLDVINARLSKKHNVPSLGSLLESGS